MERPKPQQLRKIEQRWQECSIRQKITFYMVTVFLCIFLSVLFNIWVSEQDIECLMRIVEAEAGCEDRMGKLLVANVVINRVRDEAFPDTVTEVVYQRNSHSTQFSPVSNGRIDTVEISEETKEVVHSALLGEDISQGALYFVARQYADPDKVCWFDDNLTHLFSHGGHDFFF